VRYDAVNAMLLNEFLKEHKTVQEQGAIITRQQRHIEALTAGCSGTRKTHRIFWNYRRPFIVNLNPDEVLGNNR
jgi:hypothetical protein